MFTRYALLRLGEELLREAGIDDWKTDAWLLLEAVTGISRTDFLLKKQEEMPTEEIREYRHFLEKRKSHIPVQYITGVQEFMGLPFRVNEHVLIPRMDTEILVLEAEKYLHGKRRILDMCTGSGCIASALKKRNPLLDVTAVDDSQEALVVARTNSERLNVPIQFYQSNLFEVFEQLKQTHNSEQLQQQIQFDMIISNPPYIPTAVIDGLEEEVRCHEPHMALDGMEDGLEFYRRITKESKKFLTEKGMLFYEIGHDQANSVRAMMENEGFGNVHVIQDLTGLDRVIYGGMKDV